MEKTLRELIQESGLFDPVWYLETYGSTEVVHEDPLDHFLMVGVRKNLSPSSRFDCQYYLKKYPDVARAHMSPIVHYLHFGRQENRFPRHPCGDYLLPQEIVSKGVRNTLDIGCGSAPRNPFNASEAFGVDIMDIKSDRVRRADLAIEPLPFDSNSFDAITAYDVIEHIPRVIYVPEVRYCFVELMNEIHRVLTPNGIFLSHTPAYPSLEAFSDPTHVNIITEETFAMYFDVSFQAAARYGYRGNMSIVHQSWCPDNAHLQTIMRKNVD